jgi:hypothetical protein
MDLSIFQTAEQMVAPSPSPTPIREEEANQVPFVDHLVRLLSGPAEEAPSSAQVSPAEPQVNDVTAPRPTEGGRLEPIPPVEVGLEESTQAPVAVLEYRGFGSEEVPTPTGRSETAATEKKTELRAEDQEAGKDEGELFKGDCGPREAPKTEAAPEHGHLTRDPAPTQATAEPADNQADGANREARQPHCVFPEAQAPAGDRASQQDQGYSGERSEQAAPIDKAPGFSAAFFNPPAPVGFREGTGTEPVEATAKGLTVPRQGADSGMSVEGTVRGDNVEGTVRGEAVEGTLRGETEGKTQEQATKGIVRGEAPGPASTEAPTMRFSERPAMREQAPADKAPEVIPVAGTSVSETRCSSGTAPAWSAVEQTGFSPQFHTAGTTRGLSPSVNEVPANPSEKGLQVDVSRKTYTEAAVDNAPFSGNGGGSSQDLFHQGRTIAIPMSEPSVFNHSNSGSQTVFPVMPGPAASPPTVSGQAAMPVMPFITESGQRLEQVVAEMVQRATLVRNQQAVTFDIQLKPEFMGKVRIEAVIRPDDSLTAVVTVQDLKVKSFLQSELPGLLEPLEKAGVKLEVVCQEQPDYANPQEQGSRKRSGQGANWFPGRGEDLSGLKDREVGAAASFNDGRIHYFA